MFFWASRKAVELAKLVGCWSNSPRKIKRSWSRFSSYWSPAIRPPSLKPYRNIGRTEPYTRNEHKHMNDDENKPADKDAPRGISDELVDGDTLDVADDPSKEEEEPLEPHNKLS
jgi:hypothetical protein